MSRFKATVDRDGRLIPAIPERLARYRGREVWVSLHEKPAFQRGTGANRYLWGVVYGMLAAETGNDPETIHVGLKRLAVQKGILEPQYILMGSTLLEGEPTTVTEDEQFWKYTHFVRELAEHGQLTGSPLHIPEPGE
jgi:hypothetical protein